MARPTLEYNSMTKSYVFTKKNWRGKVKTVETLSRQAGGAWVYAVTEIARFATNVEIFSDLHGSKTLRDWKVFAGVDTSA